MVELLKTELQTYQLHKDELVSRARGKYVLIKGDKIIDEYESKSDAIKEGYKRFGNVPFLVKEIVEIEIPMSFVSPCLGI